jgi:hypothetical protein
VFTARYGLIPYIKQITFGLRKVRIHPRMLSLLCSVICKTCLSHFLVSFVRCFSECRPTHLKTAMCTTWNSGALWGARQWHRLLFRDGSVCLLKEFVNGHVLCGKWYLSDLRIWANSRLSYSVFSLLEQWNGMFEIYFEINSVGVKWNIECGL